MSNTTGIEKIVAALELVDTALMLYDYPKGLEVLSMSINGQSAHIRMAGQIYRVSVEVVEEKG